MKNEFPSTDVKDPALWHLARKRVAFRSHAVSYVLVNALLWILWLTGSRRPGNESNLPWPVFPMVGWGIGLFFHYLSAWQHGGIDPVEKEYQRLIEKHKS